MTTDSKAGSYLQLFQSGRAPLSAAMLLAVALVALDILIVSTVLPTILRELGGTSLYAWAIGVYSLGNFITIPIFSAAVPKFGGRRSFTIAVSLFIVGAVLAALSTHMEMIVVGRLFQGLGSGGFFAIPFALITLYYPSKLQPRAIGLISAVWGTAAVAGPLFGAFVLKIAGWPWVFWFNLPFGIFTLILGLWALRGEGPPRDPGARINWKDPLLFATVTALLLESLARPLPYNLVLLALSCLFFILFWYRQKKNSAPIIPPEAWQISHFLGIAFMGIAITAAAFGGTEAFLPLLLQGIWDASPLEAGLILTVGSLSWSFSSVGLARFANWPRRLTFIGTASILLGLVGLLFNLILDGPIYYIYLGWFAAGLGMGMVVPTYNTLAIDLSEKYPSGVSTGAVLLAMTWGFAFGAPLAGVAAKMGFGTQFVPTRVGLETLQLESWEALQNGGSYALLACILLGSIAILLSLKMPARRLKSDKDPKQE